MKKRNKILCIALSSLMCAGTAAAFVGCDGDSGTSSLEADATLTVDGATLGAEISEDLFGIFLEDINYAGDALNAELVKNKSFGFSKTLDGWKDIGSGVTNTVKKDTTDGIATTNTEYLTMDVTSAGGGIANSGFTDGLAVTQGTSYAFSAYIRTNNYSGGISVTLSDGSTEYGSATFTATPSSEWVKYTASIKASGSCSKNLTLSLTLASAGTIDVDVVSLQPEDSVVGLRKDLAEALKDLSPNFVRFPGGCVIEGKTLSTAYDWKDSIGVDKSTDAPVTLTTKVVSADGTTSTETTTGSDAVRTTGSDIWNYSTDYGVGFYEYFELCEYLGATAVPIVNCGISCMTQGDGQKSSGQTEIGSDEFNYYLENAMDLVLFAKGSVTSSDPEEAYWAQIRTDMGHPEPFEMDYLGIGNEQWTDNYFEHFEAFRDAFIEASASNPLYASVQLIVGNGCLFSDTEEANALARKRMVTMRKDGYITNLSEYGMVDEHYYMNYTDFLMHTDHYDGYSRTEKNLYYVFAGEYSANSKTDLNGETYEVKFNSMMTATAEAAYMTGIERNGDVVKLAAYAPVFGHINSSYNQWATDMIYYDNETYVPTCNYYVQQMFAQNQGKNVLTSDLTYTTEDLERFTVTSTNGNEKHPKTLYNIASVDENGDIIIKIVNANTKQDVNVNIDVSGISFAGTADVTVLQSDTQTATNSKGNIQVSPASSTLNVKGAFIYTAKKNSVNVIKIHTK